MLPFTLLDEDEYEQHREEMNYPDEIDIILKRNLGKLLSWIQQRRGPFAQDFISVWTNRYEFNRDIQSHEEANKE